MAVSARIRRATEADHAGLTELYRAFYASQFAIDTFGTPNPRFDVARFVRERLADRAFESFVAEREGRLVGFADGHVRALYGAPPPLDFSGVRPLARSLWGRYRARRANPSFEPYVEGYFNNVYVAPEARGEGLGAELTGRCVDALHARGVDRIRTHALVDNGPGQRALHQVGFVPTMYVMEWFADESDRPEPSDLTH